MEINDGKENLTFHYNRAERLADAPSVVKKAYAGELPQPPKGLFKALVHTKASKFMLFALVFTLVITVGILMAGSQEHKTTLGGITFTMSAFSFNETVYISIKTEGNEDAVEGEEIFLSFSFSDTDKIQVQTRDFSQQYTKITDFIRTTIADYDIMSVSCDITIKAQTKTIHCSVEQK